MHAATHWHLSLIGAIAAAGAGVGYSLLAGGEVPTVRSCIAELLVLLGLAMGREAITLRLVAAGAFMILLLLPEPPTGASFQQDRKHVTQGKRVAVRATSGERRILKNTKKR